MMKSQDTNYQKTLNLPQTEFSMKANLAQKEPQLLKKWQEGNLYGQLREKCLNKTPFILHDGPPYANGDIHIGHALNKVLKDIIVKIKTMQGMNAHYVPGWDCHGLPIEHQLFKKLKKRKSEVDTLEFRKKAHEYAIQYVNIQREQFKRLGILGDWDKPYLTLSREYEYWILKSFGSLVKDGFIYRGLKPVNWCCDCETALAEAEVEYEDHTSPSVYVKFEIESVSSLKGISADKPSYLVIWTTTPWTLLANVAVAVHPAFRYAIIDVGKEIFIIESSLQEIVLEKSHMKKAKVLLEVPGDALKGLTYKHPFTLKEGCRVITTEYVTKEEGTGLVHTAPGHGQEDYEAGLVYQLDILMPVNDQGVFTKEAGKFAGQHVFKANENIIEDLRSRGLLLVSENVSHSYPHCWRCKKPVIFRATKQWFLKIDHHDLRARLKEIIKNNVEWIPPSGQERILSMVILRPDWCLSRQRHWGVPIPALKCVGSDGEYRLYPGVVEHFAKIVEKEGSDAWFEKEVKDLIPPGFKCPETGCQVFEKSHDILDVWFDSGVSHQAVIGPMMGQKLPVDLYLEGSDQHRGWFQSSLIPSVAINNMAPFKAVLTHGFVVDGDGRKMSKSLGNVISPQDLIRDNGVDLLRLWVASSSYNEDIRISSEIFSRLIDAYRKIRNTIRFLLGNLAGYDPQKEELPYQELLQIDQWALYRLKSAIEDIKENYNKYEFSKVYKMIYSFCNEDLSGFYLDILKDRLYTFSILSRERRSAQTVLFHILNHLVRLLAPILVFTADEIYSFMPKTADMKDINHVHLLNWLPLPAEWNNQAIVDKFEKIMAMRPFILKALEEKRRDGIIGSSLEAKIVFRTANQRDFEYLREIEPVLSQLFIVSQAEIQSVGQIAHPLGEEFPKVEIEILPALGEKCPRCWNYQILGEDPDHPLICARCARAVKEMGIS